MWCLAVAARVPAQASGAHRLAAGSLHLSSNSHPGAAAGRVGSHARDTRRCFHGSPCCHELTQRWGLRGEQTAARDGQERGASGMPGYTVHRMPFRYVPLNTRRQCSYLVNHVQLRRGGGAEVRCGSAGEGTGSGCTVWCTARESQLRAENKKDYTRVCTCKGTGWMQPSGL